jgi:hypothetical protein
VFAAWWTRYWVSRFRASWRERSHNSRGVYVFSVISARIFVCSDIRFCCDFVLSCNIDALELSVKLLTTTPTVRVAVAKPYHERSASSITQTQTQPTHDNVTSKDLAIAILHSGMLHSLHQSHCAHLTSPFSSQWHLQISPASTPRSLQPQQDLQQTTHGEER